MVNADPIGIASVHEEQWVSVIDAILLLWNDCFDREHLNPRGSGGAATGDPYYPY